MRFLTTRPAPARTLCAGLALLTAAAAALAIAQVAPSPSASLMPVAPLRAVPEVPVGRPDGPWRPLEDGLDWTELPTGLPAPSGDGVLRVLRVDPSRFRLRLLMASAVAAAESRTPRLWCRAHGLVAVVNAGMYARDYRTSVSLLRTRRHVNNPRVTRHLAVLAFDPLEGGDPPVRIIDRELEDFDGLSGRYGSLVQSIRMVAADGRNVWSPQPQAWSAVAAGIDTTGRVLFLHCRSPYPMHDLIDAALAMPLGLRNLMYLEGGPVAQLYVRAGGSEFELAGAFAPDTPAAGQEAGPAPIPNAIGVARLVPFAPAETAENPVPWAGS